MLFINLLFVLFHSIQTDTVKLKTRSYECYVVRDTFSGPYFIPNYYKYNKDSKLIDDRLYVYYHEYRSDGSSQILMGYNKGWLMLIAEYNADLTFDIIGVDSTAKFIFSLFKYYPKIFNALESAKAKSKPLRKNAARLSRTGLSMYSDQTFVDFNYYKKDLNPYSKFIQVNKGDTFLLEVAVLRNKEVTDPFYLRINYHNKTIKLNNVLFETNKSILLPSSNNELNNLVEQLKKNPKMQIELRGHTDNVGDEAKNQALSEGRAKAVYDYLVAKGIDKNRLSYKGFGSKKPIAVNTTEEGRKMNRRVEMVIIKE